jgi:penicillin-binding protein 1C
MSLYLSAEGIPALVETAQEAAGANAGRRRIAGPVASFYVADILRGAPPPQNAPFGRIAYKTGTSYGYRDAFAIGFDKAHTIAVWLGRPDNASVPGRASSGGKQRPRSYSMLSQGLGRAMSLFRCRPELLSAGRRCFLLRCGICARMRPRLLPPRPPLQLRIAFPPEGAEVDLGLTRPLAQRSSPDTSLTLKAEGGVLPLRWIVNGVPLGDSDMRRQTEWTPDGAGFTRVSVMDAKGATDSVLVRLE